MFVVVKDKRRVSMHAEISAKFSEEDQLISILGYSFLFSQENCPKWHCVEATFVRTLLADGLWHHLWYFTSGRVMERQLIIY